MTILMTIKKIFKTIILMLYSLKTMNQIKKKDYSNWEDRYEKNELYTIMDFIVKDYERVEKEKIILMLTISKIVKIIIKIQIIIAFILIIPVMLGITKPIETENVEKKIFIEIPKAYCMIIKKTILNKKINKEDKKTLLNNIIFVWVYNRSRWNILISLKLTDIIHQIIKKDPEWKKKKYKKTIKLYYKQILKENFNEIIKKNTVL